MLNATRWNLVFGFLACWPSINALVGSGIFCGALDVGFGAPPGYVPKGAGEPGLISRNCGVRPQPCGFTDIVSRYLALSYWSIPTVTIPGPRIHPNYRLYTRVECPIGMEAKKKDGSQSQMCLKPLRRPDRTRSSAPRRRWLSQSEG